MAASRSDQHILSTSTTLINKVGASLEAACISIGNEGFAVPFHKERADRAAQILLSPTLYTNWFTQSVSTDASIIADATAAGTVVLTAGNVEAQAALVTDIHIDNAISAEFNAFITGLVP